MEFHGFPGEMFGFLSELTANNSRDWFERNRERYVRLVREPTLSFIEAMVEPLERVSPSYVADARPTGGSMFRIHRDTRFSKDKAPYKTNVGCQFRHSAGRDAHAPGFYVHLVPGGGFVGGGIWRPPAPVLARIREAVDRDQDEWLATRAFVASNPRIVFDEGDRQKRPPRGIDSGHPLIVDLTVRTIFAACDITEEEAGRPEFVDEVESIFHDLAPLMRFINEALGLSF